MGLRQIYWVIYRNIKGVWRAICYIYDYFYAFLCLMTCHFKIGRKCNPTTKARPTVDVLVCSYYMHPYASDYGTQRINKFIKYMHASGLNQVVLGTDPSDARILDYSSDPLPKGVSVVRTPERVASVFRRKKYFVPDDYIVWFRHAIKLIDDTIKRNRIQAVLATAPPYTNLLLGYYVSRKYGVPLISDFRDPWSKIDVNTWAMKGKIRRMVSETLEKLVLKCSKVIVLADDKQYADEFLVSVQGDMKEKIITILNGYDEEDFEGLGDQYKKRSGKFVISLVGNIYSYECLKYIIDGFRFLRKSCPDLFSDLIFEYAGPASHHIEKLRDEGVHLIDHGYVSHAEAIRVRFRSDLQLFVQPENFKRHVMSGKIYEMIRTPAPILALVNVDSSVARLIRETNTGEVVAQRNAEAFADTIVQCYKKWKDGERYHTPNWSEVVKYSRREQAKKLVDVIRSIAGKEARRHAGCSF